MEISFTRRLDRAGEGGFEWLWDACRFWLYEIKVKRFLQKFGEKEGSGICLLLLHGNEEWTLKLDNLFYTSLYTQEYLAERELSATQAQLVFKYRTRMANSNENFRGYTGHTPCPLCLSHLDCQSMCMSCPTIKENIGVDGQYQKLFSNKITKEWVKILESVDNFLNDFFHSRYLENK